MRRVDLLFVLWMSLFLARAQTTQGMITGRVYDLKTGHAIEGVKITCRNLETGQSTEASSVTGGYYTVLRLAPGVYSILVKGPGDADEAARSVPAEYQRREAYELELFVAGRMEIDVPLRQSADTYSQSVYAGSYLPNSDAIVRTYAADLAAPVTQPLTVLSGSSGTLVSTLSYVVDPQQVSDLPLSGRDIYTMLVMLPGITADNATARGLGFSANGQRSSSTNFLLDGVENNDSLLTGPLTAIAPEATEEYRVSTNNFSAEYGGTGGLVANVVTRAGNNSLHGVAYGDLNDTSLDANSYQHIAGLNLSTGDRGSDPLPRQPQTDIRTGFWVGGRIIRDQLFWSSAVELFRSRGSADPVPFQVPVLSCFTALGAHPTSLALLTQFQPPVPSGMAAPDCNRSLSVTYNARIPLQFNSALGLGRVDYISPSHHYHLLGRLAVSRYDQPDFIYSIYPGFSSALDIDSTGGTLAHLWTPSPTIDNEFRIGFRNARQGWDRANSAVPELAVLMATDSGHAFNLPGSPVPYGFRYTVNNGDLSDVFTVALGRHVLSAGGGLVVSRSSNLLTYLAGGLYYFQDLQSFARDQPLELAITVARQGPQARPAPGVTPNYSESFANNQFYGFIQDNIRITRTTGLDLGLRYESFGAPRETGGQDGYFQPGRGSNITERLASGTMMYPSGQYSLYKPDRNNWAPRIGIFHNLFGTGSTVLRAAYGIFYDRPFELLTLGVRNNNMDQITLLPAPSYPQVGRAPSPGGHAIDAGVPELFWIDSNLRTPYVQSWFVGLQHQVGRDWYFEAQVQGALGRKLISTDVVNRRGATTFSPTAGRLNPGIAEDISFRSNAGSSSYTAFTALTHYRSRRGQTQVAYTWGHSIDNQSDPVQGTFDDLQFTRSSNTNGGDNRAGFTRQFQSEADRASSDFDQRHNLVVYSIWHLGVSSGSRLERLALADWEVAGLAGFRSGFPFNVRAGLGLPSCPGSPDSSTVILRNRPSLVPGHSPLLAQRVPVPGGFQLLDPTAFCDPGPEAVGNLGRNALTGPGFWNVDLSIAKSFRTHFLGETGAIQFRADFFNAFNHANLGNPHNVVQVCDKCPFGQALLGRQGVQPSFPSATPLDQLARQVQLQLKILF
jgi:hypothetical protein